MRAPQLQALAELSDEFQAMYNNVASLPPLDPSFTAPEPTGSSEPGKRPWETSKTGYFNWAVEQLMLRAKEKAKGEGGFGEGSSAVGAIAASTYGVGSAEDVRAILEQTAGKEAVANLEGGETQEDRMDMQ